MKKNLYLLMMLVPLFGWAKSDVNIESASVPTSGEYVHDNVVYKYGINNSFVAYVKAGSDFAAGSPDAEGTVEIHQRKQLPRLIVLIADPEAPVSPMPVRVADQIVDDVHHAVAA